MSKSKIPTRRTAFFLSKHHGGKDGVKLNKVPFYLISVISKGDSFAVNLCKPDLQPESIGFVNYDWLFNMVKENVDTLSEFLAVVSLVRAFTLKPYRYGFMEYDNDYQMLRDYRYESSSKQEDGSVDVVLTHRKPSGEKLKTIVHMSLDNVLVDFPEAEEEMSISKFFCLLGWSDTRMKHLLYSILRTMEDGDVFDVDKYMPGTVFRFSTMYNSIRREDNESEDNPSESAVESAPVLTGNNDAASSILRKVEWTPNNVW